MSCTRDRFDLRGRVLLQNTASVAYMGLRQGLEAQPHGTAEAAHGGHGAEGAGSSSGSGSSGVLRQLFALEGPELLDEVLEEVAKGGTYKGEHLK